MTIEREQTKWGRSRFGAGRLPAMAVAVPSGLILGAAAGLLSLFADVTGSSPLLGFFVFASCLTMPAVALVYVLVVDRRTLIGSVERPEESIESGWYERAASGSFTDLIVVTGLGATVIAFIPADLPVDLKLALPAVLIAGFLSFGIRYLVLRRNG